MHIARKIALDPTAKQAVMLAKSAGTARFAYNWALMEWNRQYEAGEGPTADKLRVRWNAVRKESFPWSFDVSRTCGSQAIINLGTAFRNYFNDLKKLNRGEIKASDVRQPRFKKKRDHEAFAVWNDHLEIQNHIKPFGKDRGSVKLPSIGWVRMREPLSISGRMLGAVVSKSARGWEIAISCEVPDQKVEHPFPEKSVGVDLGITSLATLSTGKKISGPKAFRKLKKKVASLTKRMKRKKAGSQNRGKAITKLSRLHQRIADIRYDAMHKLTTGLTRTYGRIGIEDLNVKDLMSRGLGGYLVDAALGEFRRQIEYKAVRYGAELFVHDRFYPSSRICSSCQYERPSLSLWTKKWKCPECGTRHDRDINAAKNLDPMRTAGLAGSHACGEADHLDGHSLTRKFAAKKQEPKRVHKLHPPRKAGTNQTPESSDNPLI